MLDSDNNDDEDGWRYDHGEGRLNSGWFWLLNAVWLTIALIVWAILEAVL